MNYRGRLILKDDNNFGVFDNQNGEFIELSKELDNLRNSKIHMTIKDKLGNCFFNERGTLSSRKVGKQLYDLFIGDEVDSTKNENSNDLTQGKNITQTLFDKVGNIVNISIRELTAGSEVAK